MKSLFLCEAATSYLGVDGPLRLEGGRRGGLPVPVVRVRVGRGGVSSVLLRVLLQRGDGGRGLQDRVVRRAATHLLTACTFLQN